MEHTINLTSSALIDLQEALDYYNSKAENLGFRFADEVELALSQILEMPLAYGFRY